MRATGNLAGVSFMAPPQYTPQEEQWKTIITESGYWFAVDTMRFFSSRIAWDTLRQLSPTEWAFVSSEVPPYEPRQYTARYWREDCGVLPLSELGEFETLNQARFYLEQGGYLEALRNLRGN